MRTHWGARAGTRRSALVIVQPLQHFPSVPQLSNDSPMTFCNIFRVTTSLTSVGGQFFHLQIFRQILNAGISGSHGMALGSVTGLLLCSCTGIVTWGC